MSSVTEKTSGILFVTTICSLIAACGEGVLPAPEGSSSREVRPIPLNDTGVTYYLEYQTFTQQMDNTKVPPEPISNKYIPEAPFKSQAPTQAHSAMQDAVTQNAFQFTKLDENGQPLDALAEEWSCVRDDHTGLIWERKNDSVTNMHFGGDVYTWRDPDTTTNGGYSGQPLGYLKGTEGADCGITSTNPTRTRKAMGDTDSFINVVNDMQLCGFRDWRLPLREELRSLVNYGMDTQPKVDQNFFPGLRQRLHYWTAETSAIDPARAWGFHFRDGTSHPHFKDCPAPSEVQGYDNGVMLVRGP